MKLAEALKEDSLEDGYSILVYISLDKIVFKSKENLYLSEI